MVSPKRDSSMILHTHEGSDQFDTLTDAIGDTAVNTSPKSLLNTSFNLSQRSNDHTSGIRTGVKISKHEAALSSFQREKNQRAK